MTIDEIDFPASEISEMAVLVFIPTKNDRDILANLVTDAQDLGKGVTVLVIDDGSFPAIERSTLPDNCLLFSQPFNNGLGICTHIALDHALLHGYDYIVRVDADGQHPIEKIPEIIKPLHFDIADLAVGMRINQGRKSQPNALLARLVKCYFSNLARIITFGSAPSDVSSGFFAANVRAMKILNDTVLERYPEPQMYSHACRRGLRVTEISIEQSERKHGKSTITYANAIAMIYRFTVYAFGELFLRRR